MQSWTAGNVFYSLEGCVRFFSDKYDITKHPNYKYLSDYDKKNTFDMGKAFKAQTCPCEAGQRLADYYEISEADLQEDTAHE